MRLEQQSFEAYNENELLQMEVEQYYSRYGRYPEQVLKDKIYRNRGNIAYCKEKGYGFGAWPTEEKCRARHKNGI